MLANLGSTFQTLASAIRAPCVSLLWCSCCKLFVMAAFLLATGWGYIYIFFYYYFFLNKQSVLQAYLVFFYIVLQSWLNRKITNNKSEMAPVRRVRFTGPAAWSRILENPHGSPMISLFWGFFSNGMWWIKQPWVPRRRRKERESGDQQKPWYELLRLHRMLRSVRDRDTKGIADLLWQWGRKMWGWWRSKVLFIES